MIVWLRNLFVKKLGDALKIKTPNRIPRTGVEGAKVDCYSVYVTDAEGSYLAEEVKGEHLHVLTWNEEERAHSEKKLLKLDDLGSWNIEISHYHGLVTHSYKSIAEFLLFDTTGFYKIQSKLALWKFSVPRFINGKRRLKRPSREKALEAATELVNDNHNLAFDSYRLLTEMYGSYTILHPLFPTLKQGTHLVLMSLEESGELEQVDEYNFRVKGQALLTLERLREEKAKERRSKRQSTITLWLTVVLAVATAFQSGLVRTSYFHNVDWLIALIHNSYLVLKHWLLSFF